MSPIIRAGGIAAVLGGALRIANTFTQTLPQGTLAILYFATDVLLLAGVTGLWLKRRATLGVAGTTGLAIFVLGILTIRASALGFGTYQMGAAIAVAGLALYSIETLLRRQGTVTPTLWLLSFVAGVTATLGLAPLPMLLIAAIAFGAGFICAGLSMWRAPSA